MTNWHGALSIYNRTWLSRLAENSPRCYVRLHHFKSQSDKYWSSNYRESHETPPPRPANFDLEWMEEREKEREEEKVATWITVLSLIRAVKWNVITLSLLFFISLSLFPERFIQWGIFFTFFEKITHCIYDIYWINVSCWHKNEKGSKSSNFKNYWQAKNLSLGYLKLM